MDKKYELVVGKKRIEVSEEVYKAYYKEREHEKYVEKKMRENEYSLEGMSDAGINFEHKVEEASPSPEEIILREIELQSVREAVDALNEDERLLVTALFSEGLSEREYSKRTGIPRTTINGKRKAVLKKLKNLMDL